MAYTTSTLIGNYLQRTLSTNETDYLVILIPAIKKWIDAQTNSNFDLAVESTRYFDGGSATIDLDPCNTITEVSTVNSDATQTDSNVYTTIVDYIAEPVNETVKRELRLRNGCFPRGVANISVTAIFSEYAGGVPADIQTIATQLAAGVLNQGKNASSGGNVASESLEGHSITYDTTDNNLEGIAIDNPTIKGLLGQRRELYVG